MKLFNLAHSRTGDKGNISTISVIPYDEKDYGMVKDMVTEEAVYEWFHLLGATKVERYELPKIKALNFVIYDTLDGGVTNSLALDTHGKSLSGYMLAMPIDGESNEQDRRRSL